jgi:hypothetical protein
MVHKKVNQSDAGTATKFGGNDIDKWSNFATGVDVDDYDVNSDFTLRSGKLKVRNPTNTFSYSIVGAAITADRNVSLPNLGADDTLAANSQLTPLLGFPSSTVHWGYLGGNHGSTGVAILAAVSNDGTPTNQVNYTEGQFVRYTSAATLNAAAGWRYTAVITYRGWNGYFASKFRMADIANCACYIGWYSSGAVLTGDTPLSAGSGVLVGFRPTDTNFQVMRNAGAVGTVFADTGIAKNTSIHTMSIQSNDGNSSFIVTLDTFQAEYTTTVPAQQTGLTPHFQLETRETVAKTIDRFWSEVKSGKIG